MSNKLVKKQHKVPIIASNGVVIKIKDAQKAPLVDVKEFGSPNTANVVKTVKEESKELKETNESKEEVIQSGKVMPTFL